MAQVFGKGWDTWLRVVLLVAALSLAGGLFVLEGLTQSSLITREGHAPDQPVPFSHRHHAGGLGLDCRYCHTSVEESAVAGIPPTETCMTCHSQLWTQADLLEPVRQSWRTGTPIVWRRVHTLPDFAYFDHSVHVGNGVGCVECHGRVDKMALTRQDKSLRMRFCINCHADPANRLRPRDKVFDMDWAPPPDDPNLGGRLIDRYNIRVDDITTCYTCHR